MIPIALAGPYPTLDAACAAAQAAISAPARPCASTPITARSEPFTAVLLRAPDTGDPRFAGSGAFFLALGDRDAWYLTPTPLARTNGAAGHTYLPVITPSAAITHAPRAGDSRLLLRLVETTTRVCNICEGPQRERRSPFRTQALVLVCARDEANRPACTEPIEVDEKARVTVAPDGTIIVQPPGEPAQRHEVDF